MKFEGCFLYFVVWFHIFASKFGNPLEYETIRPSSKFKQHKTVDIRKSRMYDFEFVSKIETIRVVVFNFFHLG